MADKIPYAKPGRVLGRGGPRDMQNRTNPTAVPTPDISEELRKLRRTIEQDNSEEGYGLSFEEVEKKLTEAIQYTREQEAARYKSGIDNLTEQLNAAKVKIGVLDHQLSLNMQELEQYRDNSDMNELRETVQRVLDRLEGVDIDALSFDADRPSIEENVFVNITEDREFDSHIEVKPEGAASTRSMSEDMKKLRSIVKANK